MDAPKFLKQYGVLGIDDVINSDNMVHFYYSAILNKFRTPISNEERYYFAEYQERVFNLIYNMRELSVDDISTLFDYLNEKNHYLNDIIIMMWCSPKPGQFLSKRRFNDEYQRLITDYHHKLISLIEHQVIKKFCIDSLTRENNVPVHCIDYIWFYMNDITLDLSFYNIQNARYIGFKPGMEYTDMGFNMEYILELGLGRINNGVTTLRQTIKHLITNPESVKELSKSLTKDNFILQRQRLLQQSEKYFDEKIDINDS